MFQHIDKHCDCVNYFTRWCGRFSCPSTCMLSQPTATRLTELEHLQQSQLHCLIFSAWCIPDMNSSLYTVKHILTWGTKRQPHSCPPFLGPIGDFYLPINFITNHKKWKRLNTFTHLDTARPFFCLANLAPDSPIDNITIIIFKTNIPVIIHGKFAILYETKHIPRLNTST